MKFRRMMALMNFMSKTMDFLLRRHPIPAPHCKRCGHEPCPACETWCDMLVRTIWCPHCEAEVSEYTPEKAGAPQLCQPCQSSFMVNGNQVDVDLCCDGKCEFDVSMKTVYDRCAQERAR